MYDTPEFFLVANPIDRYSIGDRTPGLHTAEDGSLTIVMQHDEPAEPERAGQLAADARRARSGRSCACTSRDDAVFDGSYELPPIVRVGLISFRPRRRR